MRKGDWHLLSDKRHQKQQSTSTPRGCLAVMVGLEGEEKQRFVVPVQYLGHPLFQRLLKDAEEEYGFQHIGAISVPCRSSDFEFVQRQIDHDLAFSSPRHEGGSNFLGNLVASLRA